MTKEELLDELCRLRSDISYVDFSCDIERSLERKNKYKQALFEVIKDLKKEVISNDKNKDIIAELSKMSPMVISTAYCYAINYIQYGEDVTERWVTATQNHMALEKAYRRGYYEAMQRRAESGNENETQKNIQN